MAAVTMKTCTSCRRGSHALCASPQCAHEGSACPRQRKPERRRPSTAIAPLPFHEAAAQPEPTPHPSPTLPRSVVDGQVVDVHGTIPVVLVDGVRTLDGCTGCVPDELGRYPIGFCAPDCGRRR